MCLAKQVHPPVAVLGPFILLSHPLSLTLCFLEVNKTEIDFLSLLSGIIHFIGEAHHTLASLWTRLTSSKQKSVKHSCQVSGVAG